MFDFDKNESRPMQKFAVFGNPIAQSLSPTIHQMFAKSCDVTLSYTKEELSLGDFAEEARQFFADVQFKGCNVTVPFKEEAFRLVDRCSPAAQLAQAVNTIKKEPDGSLSGFNTDGIGLVTDLMNHGVRLQDATVLLLGAGGAAKGAVHPLLDAGVGQLLVLNRSTDKAVALAEQSRDSRVVAMSSAEATCAFAPDVIINSTSASLSHTLPTVLPEFFERCSVAYDMVYGSEPTTFMAYAKEHGAAQQLDGLGMLVEQAAAAFTIWTNEKPHTQEVLQFMRKSM